MIAALALLLAITPHAMRAHVNFLAGDAVEGREAGTRGYHVAAAYVAAQFEAVGAEPAGDGGTYFHQVRFCTYLLDPAKSSFAIDGKTFEHRKDVLIIAGLERTSEVVDAPVVFAGFGIVAPDLGHDDYANIDVRGKIVALLAGAPPRFPHSQRAYYSSGTVKTANATERGAIGVLVIRTLDSERRFSWARTIATGESVGMRALGRDGQPRPRRSIVFAAVTAEEKSLQGSMAFADRPSIDGTIVANVNMDMITMLFPMKSIVILGVEHSTLAPLARAAAERNGFAIQNDPQPEEVRFIRSDQFSFVRKGIPAISYKGGLVSADPAIDGAKLTRDWLRDIYHSAADESDQKLDYASGVRWARTNLDLAVSIANAKEKPRWNEGDFFGTRFGRH